MTREEKKDISQKKMKEVDGESSATLEISLMVGATATLFAFMFIRIADSYTLIQLQCSVAFTVLASAFGLVARKLPDMRRVFGVTASAFAIIGLALFITNDIVFFVAFEQARRNHISPSATYWMLFTTSIGHTVLVAWLALRHVISTCCPGCREAMKSDGENPDDDEAPVFSRLDYMRHHADDSSLASMTLPRVCLTNTSRDVTADGQNRLTIAARNEANRTLDSATFY